MKLTVWIHFFFFGGGGHACVKQKVLRDRKQENRWWEKMTVKETRVSVPKQEWQQSAGLRDFRLPPWCSRGLRSSCMLRCACFQPFTDVSGQPIGPIFNGLFRLLTLDDGADMLYRHASNLLPVYAAKHSRRSKASSVCFVADTVP